MELLNNMNLQSQTISIEPKILESSFDKKKLQAGILHVGVGNFHKSHQAYLIDQMIEKKYCNFFIFIPTKHFKNIIL